MCPSIIIFVHKKCKRGHTSGLLKSIYVGSNQIHGNIEKETDTEIEKGVHLNFWGLHDSSKK